MLATDLWETSSSTVSSTSRHHGDPGAARGADREVAGALDLVIVQGNLRSNLRQLRDPAEVLARINATVLRKIKLRDHLLDKIAVPGRLRLRAGVLTRDIKSCLRQHDVVRANDRSFRQDRRNPKVRSSQDIASCLPFTRPGHKQIAKELANPCPSLIDTSIPRFLKSEVGVSVL